ncbi:MAG: glycosyltransferase [Bacteroidetes bacterium]|nr:glycosyltransferase [Bacteroidota bacterium]
MYVALLLFLVVVILSQTNGQLRIPNVPKNPKIKVCLNMIVKDEEKTIKRALISAAPYYDEYYITDTGSKDNTIKVIEDTAQLVQRTGKISHYKWSDDFAAARNYALSQVPQSCKYIFVLDADGEIKPSVNEGDERLGYKTKLTADAYNIRVDVRSDVFPRMLLVRNNGCWQWGGVRHEVLNCNKAVSSTEHLTDFVIYYHQDSPRGTDPLKFVKDAKALLKEHRRRPDCTRTVFYLAESYKNSNQVSRAIKFYELRDAMGGWVEEQTEALLALGALYESSAAPEHKIVWAYSKAAMINPERVESMYRLAFYYRHKGRHAEAYLLSLIGLAHLSSPQPLIANGPQRDTRLFIKKFIYEYGMEMETTVNMHKMGFFGEAVVLAKAVAEKPELRGEFGDAATAKENYRIMNIGWQSHTEVLQLQFRERLHKLLCLLPFIEPALNFSVSAPQLGNFSVSMNVIS